MEEVVIGLFEESIQMFFEEESHNIISDIAERNLCARLSIYLTDKLKEYGLEEYYADVEYNRKQGKQVKTIIDDEFKTIVIQSDLIVHSRGNSVENDNLIAIEMKKAIRPEYEKIDDRKRLRAMTKPKAEVYLVDRITHSEHVCGYLLGVYIIFDVKQRGYALEYYRLGEKVNEVTGYF